MATTRNDQVFDMALARPNEEHQGYGAVSYTPRGYWGGRLPKLVDRVFPRHLPTVYSYGTPIAWLDRGVWVKPDVGYSPTTGQHQGSIYGADVVSIPWDCDKELYERIVTGKTLYVRVHGKPGYTVPGPSFDND